jgi:translation elongation factor EF-1beta
MKLTKTSLAIVAVFFCLGSASTFAADSATQPVETLAATDAATPELLDATADVAETADEAEATNPEMDLAELQAEIRIACDEFAVDEKVADDKLADFVDACIAENMPAEETDAIEAVDNEVTEVEEVESVDAATAPMVTGQAATQE